MALPRRPSSTGGLADRFDSGPAEHLANFDLAAIPAASWSLPSSFAATGVHHGYRRVVVVEGGRLAEPSFAVVLAPFAPVWSAWLSWIEPGGFIVAHRDAGPHRERWQLPISTAGTMNGVEAVDGIPFRVHQWEPHRVANPTDRPRIHLVIDRDVIANPDKNPFVVLDDTHTKQEH